MKSHDMARLCTKGSSIAQSITTMPGLIKRCVNKPSDKLQAAYKAKVGSSSDHMRYSTTHIIKCVLCQSTLGCCSKLI